MKSLAALVDAEAWRLQAACRFADNALFFPILGGGQISKANRKRAVKMCQECVVRAECLDYALTNFAPTTDFGVWGGTTPTERNKLRKGRREAAA